MRATRERALVLPSMLLAMLAGCGGEALAGDDAGTTRDARVGDAGQAPDAGSRDDAGLESDAGLVRSEGFTEAAGDIENPSRGLYAWDWDRSVDLVLVKPHLGAWCAGGPLPTTFLDELRARLAAHEAAGRKVILRFVYADGGDLNACERADAMSIDVIEAHVAQLAPILDEHAGTIAFVEAGLLGMWGEWNDEHAPSGTALWRDPDNRRRVVTALLSALPEERPVLLRRPRFRQELEAHLSPAQLARVGHHNDCLFASATDYGTYDGDRSVDEWKDYVAELTRSAPAGGETCLDDPTYTSCANALPELERLGYTYVHQNYQRAVLDRWRAEGCFDEIVRRLGYRLVLRAVEAPLEVSPGALLRVAVEIENVGFAPPYTTRRPILVLRAAGSERALTTRARSGGESRAWRAGERVRVELEADVPADQPSGEWELRLLLAEDRSDARAYALLFANDPAVADEAARENVIATLSIR